MLVTITIILAVCVFVAGFYAGHDFALKDAPNDINWLSYSVLKVTTQKGVDMNHRDKVALRKLGSYLMRTCR